LAPASSASQNIYSPQEEGNSPDTLYNQYHFLP
jgi:hypothetical protein